MSHQKWATYLPVSENDGKIRKRPGRDPTMPDEVLSPDELKRRNNRRRRNREAAARVRERRLNKMELLEQQVEDLKREQQILREHNENLKRQLCAIKGKPYTPDAPSEVLPIHQATRHVSNTDVPEEAEPPIVPKTENEVFEPEPTRVQPRTSQSSVLWTPGGTFMMTPINPIKFEYPEQTRQGQLPSGSDYTTVLMSL